MKLRLFEKRLRWWPTWRGWLALGLGCAGLLLGLLKGSHSFLALDRPVAANVLVVEGWAPEYALRRGVAEFTRGGYDSFCVSGGPLDKGSLVTGYQTYADLTAASLVRLGFPPARLVAAPAAPTRRHRTYESARAVRERLASLGIPLRGVNVVTVGTHSRRSRLVFQKVLGPDIKVGVICVPSEEYDSRRWWASSEGFKSVLTDAFGWAYEWAFSSGR